MAEVTGPISTLRGALHQPHGDCDEHPGVVATHRVQGETDSTGSEMHDMCDACWTAHKAALVASEVERATGTCDWCRCPATTLRDQRDWEEGSTGRVYNVCQRCRDRDRARLQAELDEYDD